MNVEDLHSLVDDVSEKLSAQIRKELADTYILRDEMRKNFADSAFRNLMFDANSGQPLAEFFKLLKVKQKEAMDFGNRYTEKEFRAAIVNSLPGKEFDMMLQAMSNVETPADLIQQIEFFYSRVEGRMSKVAGAPKQLLTAEADTATTIQALQARIAQLEPGKKKKKEDKTCMNCKKKEHLAEDCFRDGGGKAGQWPDWWQGKRDISVFCRPHDYR